jgi:hypothetical protein
VWVHHVSGACLARVWCASGACLLRASGARLARVWCKSGASLVRVCVFCVSGACLQRVWRVAPARRACGTYMVRRERDLFATGACLVRVFLVSGASLV